MKIMTSFGLTALSLILIYAAMSAVGLALIKSNAGPLNAIWFIGFCTYGLAFVIWLFIILPALPLSVAFPISAGAIVVMTLAIGHFSLGEPITPPKLTGAALIVIGISLVYLPSKTMRTLEHPVERAASKDE